MSATSIGSSRLGLGAIIVLRDSPGKSAGCLSSGSPNPGVAHDIESAGAPLVERINVAVGGECQATPSAAQEDGIASGRQRRWSERNQRMPLIQGVRGLPHVGRETCSLSISRCGSLEPCRWLGHVLAALDIRSEVGNNHGGGEVAHPGRCSVVMKSPRGCMA